MTALQDNFKTHGTRALCRWLRSSFWRLREEHHGSEGYTKAIVALCGKTLRQKFLPNTPIELGLLRADALEIQGFFPHLGNSDFVSVSNSLPSLLRWKKCLQSVSVHHEKKWRTLPQLPHFWLEPALNPSDSLYFGFPLSDATSHRWWLLLKVQEDSALADSPQIGEPWITLFTPEIRYIELLEREAQQKILDRNQAEALAVGTLVHELHSPLNSMEQALQSILMQPAETGLIEKAIKKVRATREMMREYLDYMRLGKIECVKVSLSNLFDEMILFYQHDPRLSTISLRGRWRDESGQEWNAGCPPWHLSGHSSLCFQVLRNLCDNAFRAAENSLDGQNARGWVLLEMQREGSHIDLLLRDSGASVPKDIVNSLFQPFVTRAPGGHGLGLAFCKRAVEMMQGKIEYIEENRTPEALNLKSQAWSKGFKLRLPSYSPPEPA